MKKISIFLLSLFLLGVAQNSSSHPLQDIFEEATAAYNQGNYDRAIELFEKATVMFPKFAPSYNFLGLAQKAKGKDLNEVILIFQKATDIDPKYAAAYSNLGKVYYGMGDFSKAKKNCLKALFIDPTLVDAQFSLAWIYLLGESKPREAISYFRKVVVTTTIANAYYGLGLAYYMDHQHPQVLEMITTLRKMEQESLASQLEKMVREGRYIPPQQSGTLIMPQKNESSIIKELPMEDLDAEEESSINMKVRLRPQKNNTRKEGIEKSSARARGDRIRELQRKSSEIPADAEY